MELNEFLIEYLIGLWSLGALIKFNYLFSFFIQFLCTKNVQYSRFNFNRFRIKLKCFFFVEF